MASGFRSVSRPDNVGTHTPLLKLQYAERQITTNRAILRATESVQLSNTRHSRLPKTLVWNMFFWSIFSHFWRDYPEKEGNNCSDPI